MQILTFYDGRWHQGNPLVLGPADHAVWLGSCVFDGARAFEGVAPDLDLHCQRIIVSARNFGLKIIRTAAEIEQLAWQGIKKFPAGTTLYIRPMFWANTGLIIPEPDSTHFALVLVDMPMPEPTGLSVMLSRFRRPGYGFAPTDSKAACHYPNSARAMREARERGFDNAIMLNALDQVSELTSANIFHVKDGVVYTPAPNGTFLEGITRQRVMALLSAQGMVVREANIRFEELLEADEVFATGNYAKVSPIARIEDRKFAPGPVYAKARSLYWDYAHGRL